MKNKTKILIVGANGYLGARLYSDLKNKFEVVGTYHKKQFDQDYIQLDITDKGQVNKIFAQIKPDVIIHTANFASPRFAKENEDNFIKLNLEATDYVVEAANEINAKLIFISSFAALTNDNIYGDLKQKSEKIIIGIKAGYLVIRPSLILGMSPSRNNDRPFDRVLKCFNHPELNEFDSSWKFYPSYSGHISEIISTAIEKNIFNQVVYVFCDSVETQYSTARDILKPFGAKVKPVDNGLTIPLQPMDEQELINLGLPTCSYQEMIKKIHEEVKQYLQRKSL